MISWSLKWTKHHWFSKYGLVCCTSDLKLVMLEKYAFMSKNPIYTKILFMLYDSNGFKTFFYFHNLSIYHTHTSTHILLALCQNPLDIEFLDGFWSFWNCRVNFHRTYPISRTCPALGPDMSRSRVSQLYKGNPIPLGTLASFFHPISSVCSGWALQRQFGASSIKTHRFVGDLTSLLLRIFKH
jgi:hypothetical protein